MRSLGLVAASILLALAGCEADSSSRIGAGENAAIVFAPDRIWDYHLTIDPADLAGLDTETYVHARFQWESVDLADVGVRYKGNSSYWAGGPKYSFKVDFNRYVPGQDFHGLKKLNFNNNFQDPSMMRERLTYHLHRAAGSVAPRTAHANLYVNGTYMGVYTVIEQVDKTFLADRLGDDTGNLYKAHGPYGTLEWLGPDPTLYQGTYELKTNELANDYSGFVRFLDVLNNTSDSAFPTAIEQVFDVDTFLSWLAVDVLCSHLDNYAGLGNNYYLYDNPATGKFEFIPWDLNLSFGNFNARWTSDELLALDIYRPYGNWGTEGFGLPLLGVYQWGPGGAVAVGMPNFATIYDGVRWTPVMTRDRHAMLDVWGTGMNRIVAVGEDGAILRFDGLDWIPEQSNVTELLLGVWGADANNIFAVGLDQRVVRYDGNRWTPVFGGGGTPFIDVWGSSASDVFCAGAGVVFHYDGNTWQPMPMPFGPPPAPPPQWLFGIWGSGPADVFAVGTNGTIIHYDGLVWDVMPSPTAEFLKAVWGSAGDDVFAVGENGTIIHYDGVAWTPMVSGLSEDLEDVHGFSGTDLLVVGNLGSALHYDGFTWNLMDSGLHFDVDTERPLIRRILAVPTYLQAYEDKLRTLIGGEFSQASMNAEIDAIYSLIRDDVWRDTMKQFTSQEFEDSLNEDIPPSDPERILGLRPFVPARIANVQAQLPP